MADTFISASFTFRCTNAEMALLEEAFSASEDITCEFEPFDPSPEFAAIFPPTEGGDRWSGFLAIFDDPQFPALGADLSGGNSLEEPTVTTVLVSGATDFQPWSVAQIIQRCCQASLTQGPIGFEWAVTCSRPRPGEFGGGFCAIFADRLEIQPTGQALASALAGAQFARCPHEVGTGNSQLCWAAPAIGRSLLINAPDIFSDAGFRQWLADGRPKFTWHKGGEPDEWSDVIVLIDPSLTGEGSDSDMPPYIWDRIIEKCRAQCGGGGSGEPHIMVRLTNLDC